MCIIQNHFFTKKLIKKGASPQNCNNNCPIDITAEKLKQFKPNNIITNLKFILCSLKKI